VTDTLKAGENRLQIKVTNQWTNRQIGDRPLPPDEKVLTAFGFGRMGGDRNPEPPASGLLGPVTVTSTVSQ